MQILQEPKNGESHRVIEYLVDDKTTANKAASLSDNQKIKLIEDKFREIMMILGLDLENDSLKETPSRVAKMYVLEAFRGLDPGNVPEMTLFKNDYNYKEMLVERDIPVYSYCEHHFVPIIGKAHVAYMAKDKIIGLSKINRLVDFLSRRPQVQERLTIEIADHLKRTLNIKDVAVVVTAVHMCIASRGVQDTESSTTTSSYDGRFLNAQTRNEFLQQLNLKK